MGTTIITVPRLSQRIRLARGEQRFRDESLDEDPLYDPEEEARLEEERYKQKILEDDMKAAYERGVQDGRDVASGMYEHELRQHQQWLRNFDGVAANLQTDYSAAVQQMEDSVIKLAALLAEQILQYEANTHSHVVIEQARKAFRRLQGVDHVEIHVHPDNYAALEVAKNDIVMEARSVRSVNVVADQAVERGGCILYTRLGMIDARLTTQLGNLLEQMLATRQEFEEQRASHVPQSAGFDDQDIDFQGVDFGASTPQTQTPFEPSFDQSFDSSFDPSFNQSLDQSLDQSAEQDFAPSETIDPFMFEQFNTSETAVNDMGYDDEVSDSAAQDMNTGDMNADDMNTNADDDLSWLFDNENPPV